MGEETGRKSALRHVKTIVLLTVILAISLTPAVALRFFPRETSWYMLDPVWNMLGSRVGLPRESLTAIWMLVAFFMVIVSGSLLLLVLARGLARYERESG